MEGTPPASPPHVRDPISHDRESSPESPDDLGHLIDDDHHGDAGDHPPEPAPPPSSSLESPDDLGHQIDDDHHGDTGDHPPEPAPPSSSSLESPDDLGHQIDDDHHGDAGDHPPSSSSLESPDNLGHQIDDDHHGDAGDHPPEPAPPSSISLESPDDLGHQIDDDHHGDAGDHPLELTPPSSSNPVLSDELKARIVKQVEYYFSDENLFNDKFLTKFMKKDKEGFVPITVIASFRRMKKLVQDVAFIATALSTSSQLVVSSDGKKVKRMNPYHSTNTDDALVVSSDGKNVKRINPYHSTNTDDALLCTVLVDNLPEDHSVENIQRIFGSVGNVKNISIRQPNSTSRAPAKNTRQMFAVRGKWHAFVEYETVEAAEKAVLNLNDGGNWRTGMHVQLLVQRTGKHRLASGGSQATSVDNDSTVTIFNAGDDHNLGVDDHHDNKHESLEHSASERDGGRGHQGGRGRGRGQHYVHHASGSKGVYVKKHDVSVSVVEVQNSLDTHDEKLEVGGEHLVNEKEEHKGPRRGRGRNHGQHYHSGYARGFRGSSYGNDHHNAGDEHNLESLKAPTETTEAEEHVSSDRGGWGARWRGRGRGHGHNHFDAGPGSGSIASSTTCETMTKHPPVPKMPDGTRGFTMGRGQPPSSNNVLG